jgi:hypothetical protein
LKTAENHIVLPEAMAVPLKFELMVETVGAEDVTACVIVRTTSFPWLVPWLDEVG